MGARVREPQRGAKSLGCVFPYGVAIARTHVRTVARWEETTQVNTCTDSRPPPGRILIGPRLMCGVDADLHLIVLS